MNKCVVVPDSFKGSLSSIQVCGIARQSIRKFFPHCEVVTLPVADGGEGTVDCFLQAVPGGERVVVEVQGPFGAPLQAAYARFGSRAVVEMAAAAGLPLAGDAPDPERASTYGVGQLIAHAVERGAKEIILGLGGSATNDGGCGCAAALGARFYNPAGNPFLPTGGTLGQIEAVDACGAKARLAGVELTAMCDVKNPLLGPTGAAAVFGPQKGANSACVQRLETGLGHFAAVMEGAGVAADLRQAPGAGAAGGFGYGVQALLGGTLKPGIQAVLDMVDFEGHLQGADLVVTGEGRLDSQSLRGKVVTGVSLRAVQCGVPTIALVGDVADGIEPVYNMGVAAVFSINRLAIPFGEAKLRSERDYRAALEDILRLVALGYKSRRAGLKRTAPAALCNE